MTDKTLFILGSLSGFLSVAAGAFGAHGLKNKLAPEMLAIFETAARYQMFHAFALFAAAWAVTQFHPGLARSAGWFFLFGTLVFSGSLYLLVFTGVKTWGAVTPLGGLMLLAGWICLALSAFRK
jgi:uncharacterized membrane protein YgdD (TMEM256/DUF423 family)